MKNLGIILTAYGLKEYVSECLNAWKQFDIPIACNSFQFENFEKKDNKECILELKKFLPESAIFYDDEIVLKEHEARNITLNYLKNNFSIDAYLILDIDEFYTKKNIENLLEFINSEDFQWVAWAKINFKNYIFDGKHWTDDFCPPRIFKSTYKEFVLNKFYWDNDIIYLNHDNDIIDYKQLSNIVIPKNKLHVKHMTWLNSDRSKNKIEYQEKHFGGCAYKWNELANCVEINNEFYKKIGQIPPIIYNDTNE